MQHNPNRGYAACVNPIFIIRTPVLKIITDRENCLVGGMIRFPFAMYNEKLHKGANIPRAHRIENKLKESTGANGPLPKQLL